MRRQISYTCPLSAPASANQRMRGAAPSGTHDAAGIGARPARPPTNTGWIEMVARHSRYQVGSVWSAATRSELLFALSVAEIFASDGTNTLTMRFAAIPPSATPNDTAKNVQNCSRK